MKAEKEFTRQRDDISRRRRALPWVRVETDYEFDTTDGKQSLAELFDGKSQLIVYHFMYGPDWEQGCASCSLNAEGFDGAVTHLAQRDVARYFAGVSRPHGLALPVGFLARLQLQ